MKRLFGILYLLICTQAVYAQANVFVLVDVSKSISKTDMYNAKEALTQVLTGAQITKAFVSKGSQADLAKFKIENGDKLSLSKFGSLRTTLAINPDPLPIKDIDADVRQVINSISWTPTDDQTYITLAKAKISEYANNHNITNYKLYIISDNVSDDYGQNGRPDYPDEYTKNLAESYNTSNNQVSESGYTKIKFSPKSLFTLSFSPNVDILNIPLQKPTTVTPSTIVDPGDESSVISILSPPKSKKGSEYEIKSETVNINWNCQNCPQGIKYNISVSQYDGGKYRETKKDLVSNNIILKLPDGKFRISVSASNYPNASSDTTFVSVSTVGYGWLIFILLLIASMSFGYYYWKKIQSEKLNKHSKTKSRSGDIFTNTDNTGSPSETDYF